jgi:predicted ribosome quality control (RQC) complex YloA/Tae2 family protein
MVIYNNFFEDNQIIIGQNAVENDFIINQGKQTDIWFHLANLPSCHIIISCDKKYPITKQMINYCALLVKEHTKYKNIKKVSVNYTELKNVKRTEIPGKVIIKGKMKTIVI